MNYEPPPAFAPPQDRAGPLPGAPAPAAPAGPGNQAPSLATTLVAAAAVTGAAVLVIALVLIFSTSGGHQQDRRVTLPSSAGKFQLVRSIGSSEIETMLGNQLGSLGPLTHALGTAQVGVYGEGPSALPTIVFLGFNRSDSSAVDSMLRNASPKQLAYDLLSGAGASRPETFDPGPFGGSLRCAQATKGGTAYTPCVWVDHSTLAMVLQVGDVQVGSAAGVARQFRDAAEH